MTRCMLRVRLRFGESKQKVIEFDESTPRSILHVGASDTCTWKISAQGVAKLHFLLCWSQGVLNVIELGDEIVTLDGRRVSGAMQATSGSIAFGSASLQVETIRQERRALESSEEVAQISKSLPAGSQHLGAETLSVSQALESAHTIVDPACGPAIPPPLPNFSSTLTIDLDDCLICEDAAAKHEEVEASRARDPNWRQRFPRAFEAIDVLSSRPRSAKFALALSAALLVWAMVSFGVLSFERSEEKLRKKIEPQLGDLEQARAPSKLANPASADVSTKSLSSPSAGRTNIPQTAMRRRRLVGLAVEATRRGAWPDAAQYYSELAKVDSDFKFFAQISREQR